MLPPCVYVCVGVCVCYTMLSGQLSYSMSPYGKLEHQLYKWNPFIVFLYTHDVQEKQEDLRMPFTALKPDPLWTSVHSHSLYHFPSISASLSSFAHVPHPPSPPPYLVTVSFVGLSLPLFPPPISLIVLRKGNFGSD